MAIGMTDHVAKPIDPNALITALTGREPNGPGPTGDGTGAGNTETLRARFSDTPELLDELIGLFLEESERQMTGLRAAMATNDRASIRRRAHTLKGSASNFVEGGVTAAARHLETVAGEDGDDGALASAVERLDVELEELRSALRRLHGARTDEPPRES